MSQSSNHLRLVSWTWQWVHFPQTASTVTRSQSNRALWDVVEREIHILDCSRQICSNCVTLSWQYGPKSLRNVSKTLLNLCHKELRQFWRQNGVHNYIKYYYLKINQKEKPRNCVLFTFVKLSVKYIFLLINQAGKPIGLYNNTCIKPPKYK